MAVGSRGSSVVELGTGGSSRGLPVPAPHAPKRELLRAKRKLYFKGNIFDGEHFYLDLDGFNNTKQLETDLYEMGALVEKFFNKQVTKVITNKKEVNHNRSRSSSNLSKVATTRAAALLSKSIGNSNSCDNITIQERAKKMGMKVMQLKDILELVGKEKERSARTNDSVNDIKSSAMSAPRARKLKVPYIKIEDDSGKYRPLCSNFTKFPFVDHLNKKPVTNKNKEIPVPKFELEKENNQSTNCSYSATTKSAKTKDREAGKVKEREESKTKPAKLKEKQPVRPKNGYCEICDKCFTDLKLHFKSDCHERIVGKKEYWKTLDNVIDALPTLDNLIMKYNLQNSNSYSDMQNSQQTVEVCSSPHSREEIENDVQQSNKEKICSEEAVCDNKEVTVCVREQVANVSEAIQNIDLGAKVKAPVTGCEEINNNRESDAKVISDCVNAEVKCDKTTKDYIEKPVTSKTNSQDTPIAQNQSSKGVPNFNMDTILHSSSGSKTGLDATSAEILKSETSESLILPDEINFSSMPDSLKNINIFDEQAGSNLLMPIPDVMQLIQPTLSAPPSQFRDSSQADEPNQDLLMNGQGDDSSQSNRSLGKKRTGQAASSTAYGSDREAAMDLQEGLSALLDCAEAVTKQLQSQNSLEETQVEDEAEQVLLHGHKSYMCNIESCTDISKTAVVTNKKVDGNCPSSSGNGTHLQRGLLNSTKDSKPNPNNFRTKVASPVSSVRSKSEISSQNMEKEGNVDSISTGSTKELTPDNTKSVEAASERSAAGPSELSTDHYIFSSLSLVDNQFVDNVELTEINCDSLSVLSEITERFGLNAQDMCNNNEQTCQDVSNLVSGNNFYNITDNPLDTVSFNIANQNSSTSREKMSNLSNHSLTTTSLEFGGRFGNVSSGYKDFSDESEISVTDGGLAGDVFLNIMRTLGEGETSKSPIKVRRKGKCTTAKSTSSKASTTAAGHKKKKATTKSSAACRNKTRKSPKKSSTTIDDRLVGLQTTKLLNNSNGGNVVKASNSKPQTCEVVDAIIRQKENVSCKVGRIIQDKKLDSATDKRKTGSKSTRKGGKKAGCKNVAKGVALETTRSKKGKTPSLQSPETHLGDTALLSKSEPLATASKKSLLVGKLDSVIKNCLSKGSTDVRNIIVANKQPNGGICNDGGKTVGAGKDPKIWCTYRGAGKHISMSNMADRPSLHSSETSAYSQGSLYYETEETSDMLCNGSTECSEGTTSTESESVVDVTNVSMDELSLNAAGHLRNAMQTIESQALQSGSRSSSSRSSKMSTSVDRNCNVTNWREPARLNCSEDDVNLLSESHSALSGLTDGSSERNASTRPEDMTDSNSGSSSSEGGDSSSSESDSALSADNDKTLSYGESGDMTLCYGESSDDSVMEIPVDKPPIPTISVSSSDSRPVSIVGSSNLPHNEDACDGMSECLADFTTQSPCSSYQSSGENRQNCLVTERSISLGYHSFSPYEDSLGNDVAPLQPNVDRTESSQPFCAARNTNVPRANNLPKPNIPVEKPIKLKISLKQKSCVVSKKLGSATRQSAVKNGIPSETRNGSKLDITYRESPQRTTNAGDVWTSTPPSGLKMKFTRLNATPKSQISSPLARKESALKPRTYCPVVLPDSNKQTVKVESTEQPTPEHRPTVFPWSVESSGTLKLKFSTSLTQEELKTVSTRTHRLEHSPPLSSDNRPYKRRRKLTYEPGTLKW